MKRQILLLIIAVSLGSSLYSQPFGDAACSYRVTELLYVNSIGEKGTTLFRYDDNGRLISSVWSLDDRSRSSDNYYVYDSHEKLVSAFREFSDGLTSFERFCYDSTGNKIYEHFYRSDGRSGYASYFYDDGVMVKAEFRKYKGWLTGTLILDYDEKNRKSKGFLSSDGETLGEVTFNYDTDGNLIEELWDFNGEWSQSFTYIYSKAVSVRRFYSTPYITGDARNRVIRESYSYNDEITGPSYYYYNEAGMLATKIYTRNDGLSTKTYYHYDDTGKLLSSDRLYPDSSTALFTYVYDDRDRLITRNFFKADTLYGFESYLYNTDGDLVKAYLKNLDGWLNGTIVFESDATGRVVSGEFTGDNGFNASLSFFYSIHGLLLQIRWMFSTGKFQEYTFDYELVSSP